MRRREFIALLSGAAATWPLAARAQQSKRQARIGVLMNISADDPETLAQVGALSQGLSEAGWTIGRNVKIDYRWYEGNAEAARKYAAELVALEPDVILASGTQGVAATQLATRAVPIVFTRVADPVGAGFVNSLARPGRNTTGFMVFEYSLSGKWLELLKLIAPHMTRVAVLREQTNPSGIAQFGAIQALAPSLAVQVSPLSVGNGDELGRAIGAFARGTNAGLIVTGSAQVTGLINLIIKLAAQYKLPAIYSDPFAVAGGALIAYGPDRADQFRRAAGYIDRILKGEKAGELPVQSPVKYQLAINLKTAKALGLDPPASLLASADEVIE
jgi:putative tryptophan/tyrosine transport system substrate-binding protein